MEKNVNLLLHRDELDDLSLHINGIITTTL